MSRILIVEDEVAIADLEKDYLELSGFEVEIENDGTKGLERALHEEFDLFILDLMLPGVDGFEICKKIRETKNTPILMVSAKKDDIDKIRGLGLGADDYVTKPFSPSELVARVKAHLARYERLIGSNMPQNDIIEIRGIKIDKTARRVWVNGEEKQFTTKEFDLLTFLAENPNHVFPSPKADPEAARIKPILLEKLLPCFLCSFITAPLIIVSGGRPFIIKTDIRLPRWSRCTAACSYSSQSSLESF